MKQKMNLKSGMFNGLPAYACALLLLAAGLVLSVLYAVTVGSAELSVGEVYRVIDRPAGVQEIRHQMTPIRPYRRALGHSRAIWPLPQGRRTPRNIVRM